MMRALALLLALSASSVCATEAAPAALPVAAGEDVIGLLGSVLLMALLLGAGLWFMRRLRFAQLSSRSDVEVLAQIPLGMKEKLLVVQVGEQSLLVGCTPASMQTLHSWPTAENPPAVTGRDFSSLLKGRMAGDREEAR